MVKFCKECGRTLLYGITEQGVSFTCTACHNIEKGTSMDTLFKSGSGDQAGKTAALKFQSFIRNSPWDETNEQVPRICKNCGRDYMARIRIGSHELTLYTCKCGNVENATDDDTSG